MNKNINIFQININKNIILIYGYSSYIFYNSFINSNLYIN